MRGNHILLGLVLGATAVTLFGASLPMTRLAVSALDPWFVTSARGALAGLVAALVLALCARPVPWSDLPRLADDRSLPRHRLSGPDGDRNAERPFAHGGVILGLLPIATAVAAVFARASDPRSSSGRCRRLGAALVLAFSMRDGAILPVPGDLILFVSVAICGTGYALSGTLSRRMPGWEVISWAVVDQPARPHSAHALSLAQEHGGRPLVLLGRTHLSRADQPVFRLLALEQRARDRRRSADRTGAVPAALRDTGDRGGAPRRDDRPADDRYSRRR